MTNIIKYIRILRYVYLHLRTHTVSPVDNIKSLENIKALHQRNFIIYSFISNTTQTFYSYMSKKVSVNLPAIYVRIAELNLTTRSYDNVHFEAKDFHRCILHAPPFECLWNRLFSSQRTIDTSVPFTSSDIDSIVMVMWVIQMLKFRT